MPPSTDRPPRVDSPMSVRYIPLTFDNAAPDTAALELAHEVYPEWKHTPGAVEIVQFTDGITNTLSKATKRVPGQTAAQDDDEAILLRAYGKGTDVLIDRARELKAHELLASMDLAPPLLARFDNGIVYKFVQGHVCSPADLRRPHVYRATAKRIGQWHGSLPISAITSTPDIHAGEPTLRHCGLKDGKYTRPVPNMWSVVQQWIDALPTTTPADRQRTETLNAELAFLSARFGATPGLNGRDYIFAHCDLLSGNVIVQQPSGSNRFEDGDETERPVTIIDYEYSTPAPAAFDLANHFAEWAGFECEYPGCPTKSQRRDFLTHYVAAFHEHSLPSSSAHPQTVDIDLQRDIAQLEAQVDDFRGLPGFFWGIWGLIQAMISQIEFDYESYAASRLGEYWAWKGEVDGSRVREGREVHPRERRWAEE